MKKTRVTAVLIATALTLLTVTIASALTHYVVWGDTLWGLSRYYGTTIDAIVQANAQITDPNLIYAGDYLEIPVETAVIPLPTAVPPPTLIPPPLPTATAVPSPAPGLALGGQTLVLAYPAKMNEAGMNWVKFQYKWTAGDSPTVIASAIAAGHNQGFKVLISVTGANEYPPPGSINFASYIEFMRGLAALNPDAVEVWHEQNIDFEWPAGEISPVSYTNNMLAPVYQAVKAVNPHIMVISGALAPTGFDNGYNAWADNRYLTGMYQAGAATYMDCIGAHYNAGATSPTQTVGHPAGNHYSWYFLPMLNLYHNTFGGRLPVCFTELGYLSGAGFLGVPDDFWWAADTTVAEQAEWVAEAAQLSINSGKVGLMAVFNVDYTEYDLNGDPQAGYAMIRPDGTCPACVTLGVVMAK